MERLFVYADFDWLSKPTLIGELFFESISGRITSTYSFSFDAEWLKRYSNIILSDDLNNYTGLQYSNKDIFSCFSDALPDRWGRLLINRREDIDAKAENRARRHLSSYDYLIGIDDFTRIGAFRFKLDKNGDFINLDKKYPVPPITNIRELEQMSLFIEKSEISNNIPEDRWIKELLLPASSLGGARPKSNIIDEKGDLYIAKFPSNNDTYDVALWEHISHKLAKQAGIDVAETRVLYRKNTYHTLLSKRFDRLADNKRRHIASALTLLGLEDGDNASSGKGYIDIVDFIIRGSSDVEKNLKELYKRVAFNISIANSDDHFRNHSFILNSNGWSLSPAYDMNPTLNNRQSLLINSYTNESNLEILLSSHSEYFIEKDEAENIIVNVANAISNWKDISKRLGASSREINMFSNIFERSKPFIKNSSKKKSIKLK